MTIATDEIFGPVMQVLKFKDDRRGRRAGQHHRLRPGGRRLDPRHQQGPHDRRTPPRRHGLDQLLRRLRRGRAVRRLQDQRHRPRAGREGPRQLHRAQDRDGRARLTVTIASGTAKFRSSLTDSVLPSRYHCWELVSLYRARCAHASVTLQHRCYGRILHVSERVCQTLVDHAPSHGGPAPSGGSLITLRLRIWGFCRTVSRAWLDGTLSRLTTPIASPPWSSRPTFI